MVVPAANAPAPLAFVPTEFPFTDAPLSLLALPLPLAFACRRFRLAFASAFAEVVELTFALDCPACTLVLVLEDPLA
jgi:hypothetical protein